LEAGVTSDPEVADVGQVLMGLREGGDFRTLGEAAVRSSIENVRISSALALSTLGVPTVLAALQPHFSNGPLSQRRAALTGLAWLRFTGVRWEWPSLAVDPLISVLVLVLRMRASRVKIASVAASALVGTALVGFIVACINLLIAALFGFRLTNLAREFLLLLTVGVTSGGIVGVSYGIADVIAPRTRPRVSVALRTIAILLGFGLANLLVISAQTADFPGAPPFLVGVLAGSGFAAANEWALARLARDDLRRILLSAGGLALTAAAATLCTIAFSQVLGLKLPTGESLPWRFAGGVNPVIFLGAAPEIPYLFANAVMGAIIGIGLATGLIVGERLANQLERARYL
jgi:hypothetical protein